VAQGDKTASRPPEEPVSIDILKPAEQGFQMQYPVMPRITPPDSTNGSRQLPSPMFSALDTEGLSGGPAAAQSPTAPLAFTRQSIWEPPNFSPHILPPDVPRTPSERVVSASNMSPQDGVNSHSAADLLRQAMMKR